MVIDITATQKKAIIVNITKQIYKCMDESKVSLLILLDPPKPLTVHVNHDFLLYKLVQLNIDSTWFESYLNERTHSGKIDTIMSKPCSNPFGVPQGLMLGPIHFNIFLNDIIKINSLPGIKTITILSTPTTFNSCAVAHQIISSSKNPRKRQA